MMTYKDYCQILVAKRSAQLMKPSEDADRIVRILDMVIEDMDNSDEVFSSVEQVEDIKEI